jgi:hypothetical protein
MTKHSNALRDTTDAELVTIASYLAVQLDFARVELAHRTAEADRRLSDFHGGRDQSPSATLPG